MTIRPARSGDADALAAIADPMVHETTITFTTVPQTRRMFRAMIAARGSNVLVAERGGDVVGYATFAPFRAGPGYARTMEHTIALAPSARSAGLGRALMAALTTRAERLGAGSLVAAVSADNANAQRFPAALGFSWVGCVPRARWKFDRWIDLVLMSKLLAPAP